MSQNAINNTYLQTAKTQRISFEPQRRRGAKKTFYKTTAQKQIINLCASAPLRFDLVFLCTSAPLRFKQAFLGVLGALAVHMDFLAVQYI